jgi:histidinol-phosphate aminotransferase
MIKPHIRAMSPYKPPLEGRSTRYLLCDFNERIDPVGEPVLRALRAYLDRNELQLYPSYGALAERIASYAGVAPGQLMITNGSDQGIELVVRATCSFGEEVIVPLPSFAMYRQMALAEGLQLVSPHYDTAGRFPLSEVLAAIGPKTRLVVLGNPNNPTGTLVPAADVLTIAERAKGAAVLVDECYFEYTGVTVKDALDRFSNLFITRTFSKTWGLASLRMGYLMSCAQNIEDLLKVRGPYDVNRLAAVATAAALDAPEYMRSYVDEVVQLSMPRLTKFLGERGVRYWPGVANFVLTFPNEPERVLKALETDGILVRPQKGPGIDGALRMSVGRLPETERLIASLARALGAAKSE